VKEAAPVARPPTTVEAPAATPTEPAPVRQSTALAMPETLAPKGGPRDQTSDQDKSSSERWPLGVVGPLAWPTALEDVIGFTLWPQRYGQRLHVHGIVDVLAAMFEPKSAMAARGKLARSEGSDASASTGCGGTMSDWPADEIARSLSLTEPQKSALDQLKSSVGRAVATVKASCTDTTSMSPVERLQAMEKVLWAVRDATVLIRAPLAAFYDQLTDAQKAQFVTATALPDPRAGRDAAARMCGMSKLDVPMRQAERTLHPSGAQRASFENLQKKSFEMGQFLLASCLQPIPSTPTARLDASSNRLTAVIFATSHISVALNDFYNQLSPEQKTKFNSFGQ
jgi:hypothetical protein